MSYRRRLMLAACALALTWPAPSPAQDPYLLQCLSWVHEGEYPTGVDQGRCESRFDLPSPFTLECAQRGASGLSTGAAEQLACELHLLDVIKHKYRDFLTAEEFEYEKQAAGFGQ